MSLSEKTIRSLEESIGLSIEEIRNLSLDEEIAYVEKKICKPLRVPKNARIDRIRLCTMDEVDRKIDKMIKRKDYMLECYMMRLKVKNAINFIKAKLLDELSISELSDADLITNEIISTKEVTDEELFYAEKVTGELINENKNKVLTIRRRNK